MSKLGYWIYLDCLYSIAEAWRDMTGSADYPMYRFFILMAEATEHHKR